MVKSKDVFLAAVVGFVAGLLFAPKSGKETREEISEKADKARGAAMDAYDSIKSGARNVATEATGMAHSVKDSAEDVASEAKKRSDKVVDQAKQTAHTVKSDVDKATR
jgi:gas vesicle protein